MDTIWNITDLIVLGAGFYALYAAYVLRTQGKIVKTFLVFKDTDVSSCKDLQGYANLMSPKLMVLGGVMVAYGAVSLLIHMLRVSRDFTSHLSFCSSLCSSGTDMR